MESKTASVVNDNICLLGKKVLKLYWISNKKNNKKNQCKTKESAKKKLILFLYVFSM